MITLQTAVCQLAARGAVLTVWNSPARHFLVGEVGLVDPNRLFWFTAHGDREDDGHLLEFDRAELGPGGIHFFRGDDRVGLLTEIAAAGVDDPEDYTVAFALWQQVAPRSRPLIERARGNYEAA